MAKAINSKPETAVIVIPTYNEAENIGRMIEYLCTKTFPSLDKKWQMKILVVDGNSPDGTGKVVEKMAKKYKDVYLYTETSKDGIGAAYLKGFRYAMGKLDELKERIQSQIKTYLPIFPEATVETTINSDHTCDIDITINGTVYVYNSNLAPVPITIDSAKE